MSGFAGVGEGGLRPLRGEQCGRSGHGVSPGGRLGLFSRCLRRRRREASRRQRPEGAAKRGGLGAPCPALPAWGKEACAPLEENSAEGPGMVFLLVEGCSAFAGVHDDVDGKLLDVSDQRAAKAAVLGTAGRAIKIARDFERLGPSHSRSKSRELCPLQRISSAWSGRSGSRASRRR